MAVTKKQYSPSVNIIRDSESIINYIPTRNADSAFTSILNDIHSGVKSHILIGAFGTGKSSFLLALIHTLKGQKEHFKGNHKLLSSLPDYEFFTIVGEYSSFENYFATFLRLDKRYTADGIIKSLDKYYSSLKKKGKGLIIIVDEFGKFLEYATKNNPESELYFIQLLAEWVNNIDHDALLITTLHQDFSSYSLQLSKLQRTEWDKVKGRLKEITFNEPVEQLLYLASQRIDQLFPKKTLGKGFDSLFDTIKAANAFPLKDYFSKEFAKKLYPFDILSAAILTLSLQKYGQNERSLFSFIESNDSLGIREFNTKPGSFYSIPQVYDYLLDRFYPFLISKYNPHHNQWSSIRIAIEKSEVLFKDSGSFHEAAKLLKAIGLLGVFAPNSARLDFKFYLNYAKFALTIQKPEILIKVLEKKKIIRYVNHSTRYILSEGTDLDIELAIENAAKLIDPITNVSHHLTEFFNFSIASARAVSYTTGTPRFFQFKLTEHPEMLTPTGEIDGYVNLVFSEDPKTARKTGEYSSKTSEAVLYGHYKNTAQIKTDLFEILKVKKVIELNADDKVAINSLNEELNNNIALLNKHVLDNLYTQKGDVNWYYNGEKVLITSRQGFNQELSRICEEIYTSTPVFRNELINKTKVSSQIGQARAKLLSRLLTDLNKPNLGFNESEFPPEKSIYLSLLRTTGMHEVSNGVGVLNRPDNNTFDDLWQASIAFLDSTRNKERNLEDFIRILAAKPFKLKQGLIDCWLPIFLLANNDEFALYAENVYVPQIESQILDLITKKPAMFSIKAFNVAGIKLQLFNRYRVLLNLSKDTKPTNKLFIQTIKPFLAFYRELPAYSKNTTRLDKKTIALRAVIAKAKDPERAFFEDFPAALGYSPDQLQKSQQQAAAFIKKLQESIRELRAAYGSLVDRFEDFFIKNVIGSKQKFPAYRDEIRKRFSGIKSHLLLSSQKPFYSRLQSELDDKTAWLSSVAQACIGKPLADITDEEELLLYDRLNELIYELDNLCEISKTSIDSEKEEVVKFEITSLMQGLNKSMLRISKEKNKEVESKKLEIKRILGRDKKINLTVLARLLQELLKNE